MKSFDEFLNESEENENIFADFQIRTLFQEHEQMKMMFKDDDHEQQLSTFEDSVIKMTDFFKTNSNEIFTFTFDGDEHGAASTSVFVTLFPNMFDTDEDFILNKIKSVQLWKRAFEMDNISTEWINHLTIDETLICYQDGLNYDYPIIYVKGEDLVKKLIFKKMFSECIKYMKDDSKNVLLSTAKQSGLYDKYKGAIKLSNYDL